MTPSQKKLGSLAVAIALAVAGYFGLYEPPVCPPEAPAPSPSAAPAPDAGV